MAKHASVAKQIKALLRSASMSQTEAERNRLQGLANPNGRLTYAHRMMKKAYMSAEGITGHRKCKCGRWISANKLSCLACSRGIPNA